VPERDRSKAHRQPLRARALPRRLRVPQLRHRDGNALTCEIELDITQRLDLHAAHTLILYTFDLADFVDQLRALEHAPDGEATLGDPDEQSGDEVGLTITLNDRQGTLAGFLADSTTTRLSFEMIDIDRSFLSDTLTQLATILDAFPVRGDPAAD
jgi:hypothetical protein